jgi:hypothetical protein
MRYKIKLVENSGNGDPRKCLACVAAQDEYMEMTVQELFQSRDDAGQSAYMVEAQLQEQLQNQDAVDQKAEEARLEATLGSMVVRQKRQRSVMVCFLTYKWYYSTNGYRIRIAWLLML